MTDPEDALRDLAAASASGEDPVEPEPMDGQVDAADEPASTKRPDAPAAAERDVSEMSANALAQLSGSGSAAYDPGARSRSGRRCMHKPDVGMIGIRQASIPVLITMGLVMFALGVWGIMVKSGNTALPMADRANADQLAVLGLVGLPIGVLMFAAAGFMFYIVGKDKKKLARWESLHGEDD